MGTPDFALAALTALHAAGHNIVCVYSQPPRPKGRGHKLQKSPTHMFADTHGIPVFTPKSLKGAEAQAEFAAQNLDVAIVAAYGLILPQAVLDMPKYGCINIHGSLLPKWRGASPIQQAIWHGDEETGVTMMQMEAGLDTGPMIYTRPIAITTDTTSSTLHDALAKIGGQMSVELVDRLADGEADEGGNRLPATPQDDSRSTYAPLLKKQDGCVDWMQSAKEIDRQIRALNPWPGVWTRLDGQVFKIKSARVQHEQADQPCGEIINKMGDIACGDGSVLRIDSIQPPNKKAMDFTSVINGGYIPVGDVFS